MSDKSVTWKSYEEVATYLLNQFAAEFGLESFEGKQKVLGTKTGAEWEIDAKGIGTNNEIFFIAECKRYTTSRVAKEKIGNLAYCIKDTGAKGGIVVSPLGLQKGAAKVAEAENIYSVLLDKNSTNADFILQFLNKIRIGMSTQSTVNSSISMKIFRNDGTVEEL